MRLIVSNIIIDNLDQHVGCILRVHTRCDRESLTITTFSCLSELLRDEPNDFTNCAKII